MPIFKLWHKVFLVALVFVMAAVSITASTISRQNFSSGADQEINAAAERHEYTAASIITGIAYEKLKNDRILIDRDECADVISNIVANGKIQLAAVYDSGGYVVGKSTNVVPEMPDSLASVVDTGKLYSTVISSGAQKYICTVSPMQLDGELYRLCTFRDITKLYDNYNSQLDFVMILSTASSFICGLVLLISVYFLLRPIDSINRRLRSLAAGDFSQRLNERGGAEVAELSHNINTMAEAIEKSMGELRSIADGRRQFIDNFAHEMKTPLTSIMGFADILRIKKNVTTRQRQEFAGIIVEEAKRLRSLSGKLLELATTESVRLDITDVDTTELFNEIYVTVFPILAKAHLTLTLDTHGIVMPLDRELIKSLLYNLVDNSAKASSPGKEIRAGCVAEGGNIVMYVSDDGSGIEPEHLRRLTEPFYMVDKSRSRSAGGAGLGLSLCDQIARIHGGRLEIESTPGKGTTVRAVFAAALTSGKETRTV